MIRRPPRSTQSRSSAASDVYKRQVLTRACDKRWHKTLLHQRKGIFNLHSALPWMLGLQQPAKGGGRFRSMLFTQSHRLEGDRQRPPCKALGDLAHEHQVGRTGQREAALGRSAVHSYLNSVQYARRPLNLIKNQVLPPCQQRFRVCLLYTSDAADDLLCVDLGVRRI